MKQEYRVFCHNVAWLRGHYGLSKREMAKRLGIGTKSLTILESGQIPPRLRINIFQAIQTHFHISPFAQLTNWLE